MNKERKKQCAWLGKEGRVRRRKDVIRVEMRSLGNVLKREAKGKGTENYLEGRS
jgi:hypothetical protein